MMASRATLSVILKAALLLAAPALAQPIDGHDDEEPVRDVPKVEPPDPITGTEAQFGLLTRSERRWRRERPTEHNVDAFDEAGLIETLTNNLWADRGLHKHPGRGGTYYIDATGGIRGLRWTPSRALSSRVSAAYKYVERGDLGSAYTRLVLLAKWAGYADDTQLREIHDLIGRLAAAYVETGDLERAARLYEELLLFGGRLTPEYAAAALNQLIASHFDLGDYETALMYVRVGIAVLDDVGVGPYRAMNRIIAEMPNPETAVDALEEDFETALARLESAVASAEAQGLIVEDQWWAPVYLARHDREEAIRILRTMLSPMRDDSGDILRETAEHGESEP